MPKPEIIPVGSTSYIILPDGTLARKLQPTIINDKLHWNLSKGRGKSMRVTIETIQRYIDAMDDLKKEPQQNS